MLNNIQKPTSTGCTQKYNFLQFSIQIRIQQHKLNWFENDFFLVFYLLMALLYFRELRLA